MDLAFFKIRAIVVFFVVVLGYQFSLSLLACVVHRSLAVLEFLLQLSGEHFLIISETLLLIQHLVLSILFFLTVPLAFLFLLAIRVFVVSHHQQIPLQSLLLSRV